MLPRVWILEATSRRWSVVSWLFSHDLIHRFQINDSLWIGLVQVLLVLEALIVSQIIYIVQHLNRSLLLNKIVRGASGFRWRREVVAILRHPLTEGPWLLDLIDGIYWSVVGPLLLLFVELGLVDALSDIDARLFDHVLTLLVIELPLGFQLLVGTDALAESSWQSHRRESRIFIYSVIDFFALTGVLFGLPWHWMFGVDSCEIALLNRRLDRLMASGKRCLIVRIRSLQALIFPSDF